MAYDYRKRGEAAYHQTDARIGVRKVRARRKVSRFGLLAPVRWLYSGAVPSLWAFARLTFVLGLISLVAGVAVGVLGAFLVHGSLGEGSTTGTFTMLVSALTFSVPSVLLLVGSGFLAYLAARNDREAEENLLESPEPPPEVPGGVGGEVPSDRL
jgi:hypothetical protein